VLFYLLGYTVSNVGAFAALILAGRRGAEAVSYDDLAGYARRHPAAGFALAFFLLSLTGVPPTVGFFGKFYIIRATLDAGYTSLAIIALLNSAVSAYYYLGVMVKMYMRDPAPGAAQAAPMKSFYVVSTHPRVGRPRGGHGHDARALALPRRRCSRRRRSRRSLTLRSP
jgi:NADH-quinone oxidoreductase subunit N